MSSTRDDAELPSRLRFSRMKDLTRRLLRNLSVAYIHNESTRSRLGTNQMAASAWPIPFEITNYEVLVYLSGWDILSLGLTNRAMLSFILPTLYSSVNLRSNARCLDCLQFLISRPDIAGNVQTLVIAPNFLEDYGKRLVKEESAIARILERIIPNLHSLRKFRWDGLDMPKDSIWSTLRTHCPLLTNVGAGTGDSAKIKADSQLFSFDNLSSFSLLADSRGGSGLNWGMQQLPQPLIHMLRYRCPDLEELVIGSTTSLNCARHFEGLPLIEKTWPKLRIINLGHVWFYDRLELSLSRRAQSDRKVLSFLASLPSLQQVVGMPHLFTSERSDNMDVPFPLPLTSVATYHLDSVLVHHLTLQELDLRLVRPNPVTWRFWNVPSGSFHAVARLTMSFRLGTSTAEDPAMPLVDDHIETVQTALRLCPQLLHLRIICDSDPSSTIDWGHLSSVLRGSHLQSLDFSKWDKPGDTSAMTDIAAGLAVEYLDLESITLRAMHYFTTLKAVFCSVTHSDDEAPCRVVGHEWYRIRSGEKLHRRRFSRDLVPCHRLEAWDLKLEGASLVESILGSTNE